LISKGFAPNFLKYFIKFVASQKNMTTPIKPIQRKLTHSGSQFIDRSHANLSETVKKLTNRLAEQTSPADFRLAAEAFLDELTEHFEQEEMFLQAASFGNLELHRLTHKNIVADFQTILESTAPPALELEFVRRAQLRLFEHELIDDQEFWGELSPLNPTEDNLISWRRELETGDKEMDEHHKALVNYINRTYARARSGEWLSHLSHELENIRDFAAFHFADEESLLAANTPTHLAHKNDHAHLITKLNSLIEDVKRDNYDLDDLFDYIAHWLVFHLSGMDRRDLV